MNLNRVALGFLAAAAIVGCGKGTTSVCATCPSGTVCNTQGTSCVGAPDLLMSPPDATTAAAADMTTVPDSAAIKNDLAVSLACSTGADCRLFSSYCSTAACQCIPLPQDAPDPPCEGLTVSCLMDPCNGKIPVCDQTKMCAVGP